MLGNDLFIAASFVLAAVSLMFVLFTKKKLVFGAITLGLFAYFYIANSMYNIADNITILTFIVGICLLSLELFIPSFGIIGVTGLALTIYSVMDSFVDKKTGLFVIIATGLAVIISLTIFIKLGFRADLFADSILETKEIKKEKKEKEDLKNLLGATGVTKTILRPTGRIEIDGNLYDGLARSEFIEENTVISVVDIREGRIIVKEK